MATYAVEERISIPYTNGRYEHAKRVMLEMLSRKLARLLISGQPIALEVFEKESKQSVQLVPNSPIADHYLLLTLGVKTTPVIDVDRSAIYRDTTPQPNYMKWNEALMGEICRGLDIPADALNPPTKPKSFKQKLGEWWKEMQKPMPYAGPRG